MLIMMFCTIAEDQVVRAAACAVNVFNTGVVF